MLVVEDKARDATRSLPCVADSRALRQAHDHAILIQVSCDLTYCNEHPMVHGTILRMNVYCEPPGDTAKPAQNTPRKS